MALARALDLSNQSWRQRAWCLPYQIDIRIFFPTNVSCTITAYSLKPVGVVVKPKAKKAVKIKVWLHGLGLGSTGRKTIQKTLSIHMPASAVKPFSKNNTDSATFVHDRFLK